LISFLDSPWFRRLSRTRFGVRWNDEIEGMRCDRDGNLWICMGGGEGNDSVAIYAPDGKMIGKINTPERVANLCFGGAKRNRLYMCGTTSLYTEAEGATLG